MEQGFKSGLKGQRYGAPPPQARGDPYYDDGYGGSGGGGLGGYSGRRRKRGGIIHGIIGGVMGAVQGQKNPVQEIKSGGRLQQQQQQQQGGGYGGSSSTGGHVQESGVHDGNARNEFPPPEYDPRQ